MRRRLAEASRLLNADGAQHNTALRPTGMMKFLGQDNMPQARGKDPVHLLIPRCLQTEEPREEALLLALFVGFVLLLYRFGVFRFVLLRLDMLRFSVFRLGMFRF